MWKTQAGWFEAWFDHPAYPVLYAHRDQTEADNWVDTVVHRVFTPETAAGPVLDCGCGHGRHARRFADHGIPTVGIDLSARSIEEAQLHPHPKLSFVRGDLRVLSTLFPQNHFAAALSLFTSFGYLESAQEDLHVIREVHAVVRPGGMFMIDFLHVAHVRAHLVPEETVHRRGPDGTAWRFDIRRHETNDGFVKSIAIAQNGAPAGHFEEFVRAYTPEQLDAALRDAGFTPTHLWGDYQLRPFTAGAPRCIIAAQKT